MLVVVCQRFGTAYQANIQGSSSLCRMIDSWNRTYQLSRNVDKQFPTNAA